MKNKILTIILMGGLVLCAAGCGKQESKNNNTEKNKNEVKETIATIDDNASYFVSINGKKFNVGDKISEMTSVGLSQNEKEMEQTIKKNTYLIGGGYLKNSDNKRVISVTPFNDSDDEISGKDAKIGGVKYGTYEYARLSQEELALNAEFVGGLKLGSSLEDVIKVFGETDDVYESSSLGYKKYTYKSKEVYRSFEITVDKNGKVSEISFKNLVYKK